MFMRTLGMIACCLGAVCLIGVASAQADPLIFYDDFQTMDWTPVNPDDCPTFTVGIEQPGFLSVLNSDPSCGDLLMDYVKPLCRPIAVSDNFTVSFKIQALNDVPNGMTSMILDGLNDNDERVFSLMWSDAQAATGYGTLQYKAENTDVYFSGWYSTYATINDVMELRRSGDRWTAWLGDTQMGGTLVLTPTMEITKLRIRFWNVPDTWVNRNDTKIDYIAIHTAAGGDTNGDGNTNIGDAVSLINYIFKGGPPPVEADDAGCSK
jgi:hypothetical protein